MKLCTKIAVDSLVSSTKNDQSKQEIVCSHVLLVVQLLYEIICSLHTHSVTHNVFPLVNKKIFHVVAHTRFLGANLINACGFPSLTQSLSRRWDFLKFLAWHSVAHFLVYPKCWRLLLYHCCFVILFIPYLYFSVCLLLCHSVSFFCLSFFLSFCFALFLFVLSFTLVFITNNFLTSWKGHSNCQQCIHVQL